MTRIPTPPLPDENEVVEVPVEVIKEVPVAAAAEVPPATPDPVLQLLTELRDNMFAMSQHLQANANAGKGNYRDNHHHNKALPEIPDWKEEEEVVVTAAAKTPTEPSSTKS